MRKARAHKTDIAIVDIRMPPTHTDEGLRAARGIREELPGTGVLVLSQYIEEEYALELLGDAAAGIGYLLKDRISRLLVDRRQVAPPLAHRRRSGRLAARPRTP